MGQKPRSFAIFGHYSTADNQQKNQILEKFLITKSFIIYLYHLIYQKDKGHINIPRSRAVIKR